ncbi:transposase [Streptomyces murinus]|uniref:transposase n=1 Tax=Streptomyces murinus TaxID=33900 RepID=UPI003F44C49C
MVEELRGRGVGASSRNYRFSANAQVVVDAETRLVVAARPVPGNIADARAWRDSGLAEHCHGVTVLGDGAYISTGLIVPHRKRPGRALLKARKRTTPPTAKSAHASSTSPRGALLRDYCRRCREAKASECVAEVDGGRAWL